MIQLWAWLVQFVETVRPFAYALVFCATFFETLPIVGLIVPGGLIAVFGGFLVFNGSADMGDMIAFATAGAFLGDWFSYALGRLSLVLGSTFKIEKVRPFAYAQKYLAGHGRASLIWSRFVPPLRGVVPFISGMGRMPAWRFLMFNLIGAVAWSAIHIVGGYLAGHSWRLVATYLGEYAFAILLIVFGLIFLFRWRKQRVKLPAAI